MNFQLLEIIKNSWLTFNVTKNSTTNNESMFSLQIIVRIMLSHLKIYF